MLTYILIGLLIFIVATLMTMVGKGGGNFYVVILTLAGIPMYRASTTGQFILFTASVAALTVFHKRKSVSWPLAIFIGGLTSVAALGGGYFSHLFGGATLKVIFAVLLGISGAMMLYPPPEKPTSAQRFGVVTFRSGAERYRVNLWIALPVTLLTGFAAGMVGVSGGSFLVPLMVLACGVPMRVAVGTASVLIAATSSMGFAGHAMRGDFDPALALPLAVLTILGGLLGGKFALKTKPRHLKTLFAYTNWIAALLMLFNALHNLH